MKNTPFCHLHLHTCYSLLDSTCKIDAIMERALELGQTCVAMTDHGAMYGAVEFYDKARKAGIKPIIGCEIYLARKGADNHSGGQSDNLHLVLLAENQQGYQNLIRLVSQAHLDGFYDKPRVDKAWLRDHAEGLIALSACLKGEITEAAKENQIEKAVALAEEYRDIFGSDSFFLEIQDHGIPEERRAVETLREVSRRTGIPLVATNNVHYLHRKDHEAHDVLICLQHSTLVSDPDRMKYAGDQFYMKSGEEMLALFPDDADAVHRTVEIARRCNVEFFYPTKAEDLHFPAFPLPAGISAKEHMLQLGREGLKKLYGLKDPDQPEDERGRKIKERFYYEAGVIEQTNYINCFLVVQDFIRWAKENGIPVGPGRGAVAGSLLAYSLGITAADPLEYGLIFERFLNPDRISPPDFDIDFCPTRRADVIKYVREKYGEECVARIITFGTFDRKTLMRDIGRVLNLPLTDCDRVAKLIPDMTRNLQTAQEESPDFKAVCKNDPVAMQIMKYAPLLEGLPRHTGKHAAGVVIGEKPLIEILPLTREQKEKQVVVQFEKGPTEQIGLLKIDFLGLDKLTTIQKTIEMVERNHGVRINPEALPLDDPDTFALLGRGDTAGVFQLESCGARDTLRQVGPDTLQDIIAILALYRPGPMQFIPLYARRKHGHERFVYDHPLLEPILKETYGIIVYQEQIQIAAHVLAGFSLGQGDILRRAMGKKKPCELTQQRENFIRGCRETNHIEKELAGTLFDNIEKGAAYGFNKSHATAYALLSYQTAYLKAHYPAEFADALIASKTNHQLFSDVRFL
jgi:DNA polymerase III subunit alpha